jgi:hypothetical protein
LRAAPFTEVESDLIVIEAVPVGAVVIAAAFARSSLVTVKLKADSLPLMSLKEKVTVEAAIAA